jgi:hypothetical protein
VVSGWFPDPTPSSLQLTRPPGQSVNLAREISPAKCWLSR